MAVCYFDYDYKTKYNCEYEEKNNGIEVIVDYDISDELPVIDGMKHLGGDTEIKNKDILIIDYKNKKNILLKESCCNGISSTIGTPDGGSKTKYFSNNYLYDTTYENLSCLGKDFLISKVKLYSNLINELIGNPSVSKIVTDDNVIINLNKNNIKQKRFIGNNNIENIVLADTWRCIQEPKNNQIKINLNGYIELELKEKIDFFSIYKYIIELIIFLQLLKPNKLNINKIEILVEDKYYGVNIPLREIEYKEKYIENTVKDDLLDFLDKCYKLIPYRNSKNEIRNISHIILNTSRNIEDNFLMMYKFIECYYKNNGKKDYIAYSLQNNYKSKLSCSIEDMAAKIISLRNHYVHKGYYIDNGNLEICYKLINRKKNPKDYIENNVDFEWIYDKTKILYKIVIDIIFSSMLGYTNYHFDKHF